jgi:hypothetical protein
MAVSTVDRFCFAWSTFSGHLGGPKWMKRQQAEPLLDQRIQGQSWHPPLRRGLRIVGEAIVLSRPKGELGLQEQILANQKAPGDRSRNRPPHCRFIVMAALVGGVDTSKSVLKGELSDALRLVRLPSRPV